MKKIIAMLLIAALALTSVFAQGGSESSDLDTVRVAYMTNYASLCSLVAGMQTGAFAEQGIEVELVEFADGLRRRSHDYRSNGKRFHRHRLYRTRCT